MKKFFSWVVIVLAILLPAACMVHGIKRPTKVMTPIAAATDKTIALVKYVDSDGDEVSPDDKGAILKAFCGAVWVSNDVMITAEHCVDSIGRPKLSPVEQLMKRLGMEIPDWDPTDQPVYYSTVNDIKNTSSGGKIRGAHDGKVLAIDRDNDLALIKATPTVGIDIPEHLVAKVANNVDVGDKLDIIGHPLGMWWTYVPGVVAAMRPDEANPHGKKINVIQVSAPIWFGNSGGGAYNSNGELVGVASWIMKAPNTAFFVHYNVITRFLHKNRITQ